ncbi:phage tail protein [Paenibacillus typhae]|uniref:phage tail protein n=1 Tax=Paenibacillus typhae TaxID=1174501 RepID=UPI001C8E8829|nr:hypothetical protein [Paenibacillus typhae]MBY0011502.1 hypothetical protein [Paenibacillus typhae]
MAVVKNLLVRAGADFTALKKATVQAQRDLNDFKNNVSKAVKGINTLLAGIGAGFLVGGAIKDAIQYEAAIMQINRTLGSSAGAFQKWANENAAAMGMSTLEITKYAAVYSNLISGFSATVAETTQRTQDLLKASAIVAAGTGRTMEDTMERIRSGLLGNTEAIEDLGINVNVALLESTRAFQAFANGRSWDQIDFQTQQTIRLMAILEQASIKYGNTVADNTAYRQAAFVAQLKNTRLALGQAFLPIYNYILPALTRMAAALAMVTNFAAQFVTALFGGSSASNAQAKSVADQTGAVSSLADAYKSAGDQATAAGDAAKKAGKKAKQSVAGFDQLNLVGGTTGSDGADGTGDAGGMSVPEMNVDTGTFGAMGATMIEIGDKAQAMADKFRKTLGSMGKISLEPLRKSLAGLWEAVKPFAKNIGEGLKWFLKEVLVPLAKWTVEKALPAFIDVLAGAIRVINSSVNAFKPAAKWLFDSFLRPIAEWTGGAIVSGLAALAGGLNQLSSWIDGHQQSFVQAAAMVAGFFAAFQVAGFLPAIGTALSSLGGFLVTVGELITTGGIVTVIMEGLASAFAAVFSPVNIITGIIAALIISFVDLYRESESFRKQVTELGKTWLDALKPVATFVTTVLTDAWKKILQPAIKFFVDTLIPQLLDIFKQLWQKVLVPLGTFIGTVLKPVFQILADVLTMIWKQVVLPLAEAVGSVLAKAWESIYEILTKTVIPVVGKVIEVLTWLWKNVINPVVDVLWKILKPAFETVFKGIGAVIDGLKTTLNGIMDFITGVFTGNWSKAWDGVKGIFKGVFDALVGIVKVPLNLIIDMINAVIKGLNKIQLDLPDFLGGGEFGVNIKQIPKLAKGGLAFGPTLAMVGDNRGAASDPEVVAPLSKLQDYMPEGSNNREVVSAINELNRTMKESGKGMTLEVNGVALARVVAAAANDIQRRTGKPLFNV